ncbi:MAG: acyltransferase [Verrucomicrobiales bacterium]
MKIYGNGKLPSLDGLRAIAIFLVIGDHWAALGLLPESALGWWHRLFSGSVGVRVFFVLSGYLITTLLLREASRSGKVNLKRFYARRAFRILPCYFLFLIALAISDRSIGDKSYIQAITFTTYMWGAPNWETSHLWSLAVEMQFYFVWPVLFRCVATKYRWLFPAALILISPVIRVIDQEQFSYRFSLTILTHGDELAFGCLAAILSRNISDVLALFGIWQRPWLMRLGCVVVFLFVWQVKASNYAGSLTTPFLPSVQACCIALLILSLVEVNSGVASRLLNIPALCWVGSVSYSLYIWQQIFLGPYSAVSLGEGIARVGGVFLVATGSFYLIETPARCWGKRFFLPQSECPPTS